MNYYKTNHVYTIKKYDGKNLQELKEFFRDFGAIQAYVDGMLSVDTPHGRLTVRIGEYIAQDHNHNYRVCTAQEINANFEELATFEEIE